MGVGWVWGIGISRAKRYETDGISQVLASQNLEKQAEEEEAMASNIPFEERNGE